LKEFEDHADGSRQKFFGYGNRLGFRGRHLLVGARGPGEPRRLATIQERKREKE